MGNLVIGGIKVYARRKTTWAKAAWFKVVELNASGDRRTIRYMTGDEIRQGIRLKPAVTLYADDWYEVATIRTQRGWLHPEMTIVYEPADDYACIYATKKDAP